MDMNRYLDSAVECSLPEGLSAWTYGIFDVPEVYNDMVAVVWSGIFSCAMESRKLFGGILPPGMPAIYPNHRGHGCPDDCSDNIISYPGIIEDIRTVSDFASGIGFTKILNVYFSVSCPPGFADMIESVNNGHPRKDATIFISPPDKFYRYVPFAFRVGSGIARNGKWTPKFISSAYREAVKRFVRKNFHQMDDGVTRMRYMDIEKDMEGILRGLNGFPYISETYADAGDELRGRSIMVAYGDKELTIPVPHILNFAETLRRKGADVKEVCCKGSGHWVTAKGNPKDVRILDIDADMEKVNFLSNAVYGLLNEWGILKPCAEEDLMTIGERVKYCSGLLEAEPDGFYTKRNLEGDGTLVRIPRKPLYPSGPHTG